MHTSDPAVRSVRPRATYSMVACDASGALGVGVQSHWFNVGAVVPWVEAGVGAVAVQSFSGPEHGLEAMSQLRAGKAPKSIVEGMLADDPQRSFQQISVLGADGRVTTHTGERCIPESGHRIGDGYSAQANLMDLPTVWGSMGDAFEESIGQDLVERLLLALEAAEAASGDVRGRQSAAIVVSSGAAPAPLDRIFDLRVEDHPEPVAELRRLVRLRRAYIKLNEGDQLVARGDLADALAAYEEATRVMPEGAADGEAAFWTAIAFATTDRLDEAVRFMELAARDDRWARLVPRLVMSGILPDDPTLVGALVRAAGGATTDGR